MPVPMVRYSEGSEPLLAPQLNSPSAAALTSVSIVMFTFNSRRRIPATSVLRQPGLGVDVMYPYDFESGLRSSGPKQPMPMAVIIFSFVKGRKKSITPLSVSPGDVVLMRTCDSICFGPLPTMQTNLVPPASMPPKNELSFMVEL